MKKNIKVNDQKSKRCIFKAENFSKSAFTLAEGRLACTTTQTTAKAAFTLTEVLITLAIIGVVAALTIPAVVKNYQERAWNTASTVFERKLEEALKSMNTQETLAGYSNTLDFVNELSKHIKINKICKNDNLMSCFEDKVYWGADKEEIDMSKIKDAKNFGQKDWGTENIGIQFANGVTALAAYNPDCSHDPYNNQYTGVSCLAMLYDTDGFKNPNTQLKDLRSINVQTLGVNNCAIKLSDGTCLTSPFYPEPLSHDDCIANKSDWGIKNCRDGDDDYWGGAVKACNGIQNMPKISVLKRLGNDLYPDDGSLNSDLAANMGFIISSDNDGFYVWSSSEKTQKVAVDMHFGNDALYQGLNYGRNLSNRQAVCLGKS